MLHLLCSFDWWDFEPSLMLKHVFERMARGFLADLGVLSAVSNSISNL